jgi:hypothetical protein
VAVIDRLAQRAQKRVGDLPGVDGAFLAITVWLVLWGFAILFVAVLVYLVGSLFGWWHADIPSGCDPYTSDCH